MIGVTMAIKNQEKSEISVVSRFQLFDILEGFKNIYNRTDIPSTEELITEMFS